MSSSLTSLPAPSVGLPRPRGGPLLRPSDRRSLTPSIATPKEAEAVPALVSPDSPVDASAGEVQFDRMTEEDLLRGLEGLVPPAETEDDGE